MATTIQELEVRMSLIEQSNARLTKLLDGNGQPGLIDKMETSLKDLDEKQDKRNAEVDKRIRNMAIVLTALVSAGPPALEALLAMI